MVEGVGSLLDVRVVPGAGRDSLDLMDDGRLKVRIRAPARKDAANRHLVKFLARSVLGVPASSVEIVSGRSSRDKVLSVDLSPEELDLRLRRAGLDGSFARPRGPGSR